jgi:hypothetical protein
MNNLQIQPREKFQLQQLHNFPSFGREIVKLLNRTPNSSQSTASLCTFSRLSHIVLYYLNKMRLQRERRKKNSIFEQNSVWNKN